MSGGQLVIEEDSVASGYPARSAEPLAVCIPPVLHQGLPYRLSDNGAEKEWRRLRFRIQAEDNQNYNFY